MAEKTVYMTKGTALASFPERERARMEAAGWTVAADAKEGRAQIEQRTASAKEAEKAAAEAKAKERAESKAKAKTNEVAP